MNNLIAAGESATKAYTSVDRFKIEQQTALDNEGKANAALKAAADNSKVQLNFLQKIIKNSGFLKAGLKAAPYVAGALEFINFFVGGGASQPQAVQLAPMSLDADIQMAGSIY